MEADFKNGKRKTFSISDQELDDASNLYRPDVADRLKRRHVIETKVVKMKLNTFCRSKAIAKELDGCSQGITRVFVEASRFLNMYVLHKLDDLSDFPKMDQTFVYRAFSAICKGERSTQAQDVFGERLRVNDSIRPDDIPNFDSKYVTQLVNYAGKTSMTACQNHVVLGINSRVQKSFKLFMESLEQKFRAIDKNQIVNHFMKRMTRESTSSDEQDLWGSLTATPGNETTRRISEYILEQESTYSDLLLDKFDTNIAKKNWWKYSRWRNGIQLQIESNFPSEGQNIP